MRETKGEKGQPAFIVNIIKGIAWLVDHGRSRTKRQLDPEAAFTFALQTATIMQSIDYTIFCAILGGGD
jgi:hypothetical protein